MHTCKHMDTKILVNGRWWRVVAAPGMERSYGMMGDCDPITATNKAIRVDPEQSDDALLDTLIHEAIHAGLPDVKEQSVIGTAAGIAAALKLWFTFERKPAP